MGVIARGNAIQTRDHPHPICARQHVAKLRYPSPIKGEEELPLSVEPGLKAPSDKHGVDGPGERVR